MQSGTFFYHSHDHVDRQQALGLYGALIIDPAQPDPSLQADHEYTIQLQEWLLREGLTFPAMPMDGAHPNFFTINGRAYPSTDTIRMKVGETVRIRFIGSHTGFIHPMHIHGGPFVVVAIDGETLAPTARYSADTVKRRTGPALRLDGTQAGHVDGPLPHPAPPDEQQRRDPGRRRPDDAHRGGGVRPLVTTAASCFAAP